MSRKNGSEKIGMKIVCKMGIADEENDLMKG